MRKIIQLRTIDIISLLTILMLFLAGMNFGNRYYFFSFFATLIVIFGRKKAMIDSNAWLLAILAIFLLLFSPDTKDKLTSMIKPFLYMLSYVGGLSYVASSNKTMQNTERKFVQMIVILSCAPFVHYLLNFISNIGNSAGRNTLDFWTHTVVAATLQSAMSCMIVGVACGMLCSYGSIFGKILSLIIIFFALAYNMILGGRTLFVIIIFVFLCLLFITVFKNKTNKKKYQFILGTIVFIVLCCILYVNDFYGIRTWIEQSNFYYRFWVSDSNDFSYDLRIQAKLAHLKNFPIGMLGGHKIKDSGIGYAHDILLDTYDEGGIFALLALLFFLINSIRELIRFCKNKCYKFETKQIVLGVYLSVFTVFALEPVLQGAPWLFALFCFIHGQMVRSNRIIEEGLYNGQING